MAVSAPAGYLSHFARLEHCLTLRREGKTYRQIADVCGLRDEKAAQILISKAIKRILRETAEEVRSIELSRLEILIKTLWDDAILDAKAKEPDFRRLDRVKQLLEAKLKFCGAQQVVEDHSSKSVTIVVNSYTKNTQVNHSSNTELTPAHRATQNEIEEELALLAPENPPKEEF